MIPLFLKKFTMTTDVNDDAHCAFPELTPARFLVTVAPFNKQGDYFTGRPCNSSKFFIFSVTGAV